MPQGLVAELGAHLDALLEVDVGPGFTANVSTAVVPAERFARLLNTYT